jgi:hypothetical protein
VTSPDEGPPAGTSQGAPNKIESPPPDSTETESNLLGADEESGGPEVEPAISNPLAAKVADHQRRREQRRLARQEFAELRRHGVAQRHANKLRRMPGGGGRR